MTTPTDAELQEAYDSVPAHGDQRVVHIAGLRAVLAKWGQPQAVAGGEPVAWLSVDCIGERYLCFTRPDDDDPVRPLVFGDTAPPTHDQETPASIAVAAARKMLKEET